MATRKVSDKQAATIAEQSATAIPAESAPKLPDVPLDKDALKSVLDAAVESIPEPSPTFAPSEPPKQATTYDNPFGGTFGDNPIKDSFDAALHEVDENGLPVYNADGSHRRKRGRKTGVSYGDIGRGLASTGADPEVAKRKAAAQTAASVLIASGMAVFGPEWAAQTDKASGLDERKQLVQSFEAYFEAAGTVDIPPSLALIISIGAYALPRFSMPATQEKAVGLLGWIKEKWRSRKGMRISGGEPVRNAA